MREATATLVREGIELGSAEVIKLLIGAGATLPDDPLASPLHAALRRQDKDAVYPLVQVLLGCGADPNERYAGAPALHTAVAESKGEPAVVELLIHAGADVRARDLSRRLAISVARRKKHDRIVALLEARGGASKRMRRSARTESR